MKITIISNVSGYAWPGSEEVWYRMALKALENGHHVTACLHSDIHEGEPLKLFRKNGGRLLEWSRGKIARWESFRQKLIPNFSDKKLGNPDLLLLSAGSLPALCGVPGLFKYLQKTNIPIAVLCLFNAEALAFSPDERTNIHWLLSRAEKSIFVCDENRRLASRQFAVNLSAAENIPNPIRKYYEAPLPFHEVGDELILASVARMETLWKGQDLLVEVLANSVWRNRQWKLKLFGLGPDLEHIRNVVQMHGLQNKVSFEGYAKDMRDIWCSSHVMVLPSRGEGTPLAILEAMMCARPVLTTDVGGNSEVLSDGVSGWLVDAATPKLMAAGLERVWSDRWRLKEMGIAAHEKAKELFKSNPSARLLTALEQVVLTRQ